MRILFFFLVIVLCAFATKAQQSEEDPLERKKSYRPSLFSPFESGWYVGPVFQYELDNFSLGGEVKRYRAMSDLSLPFLLSWSQYVNFRSHLNRPKQLGPNNTFSLGVHVSIFSLETNISFDNDQFLWDFTPKLIIDIGSFNFSYGYKIPTIEHTLYEKTNYHVFSIKYGIKL